MTMLIKQQVTETLQDMPDEFEMDEIVDRLILLDKIQQGLMDFQEGKTFTEEEAAKRLEKWLK